MQLAKSSTQGKNKNISICMTRLSSANCAMSQTMTWAIVKYSKPKLARCVLTGELHWSNCGHNYKKKCNNYNDGDKKCSKKREEVHALDDDNKFDCCVSRILAKVLPHTPRKRKLKTKSSTWTN